MFSLIILFIFGFIAAVFAVQNTQVTSVQFGQYGMADVPLFAIVLAAALFGIFVSWLISLTGNISASMAMRGKDGQIRDAQAQNNILKDRIHELEVENARLRGEEYHEVHQAPEDKPVVHEEHGQEHRPPNPFVRIRQRFS